MKLSILFNLNKRKASAVAIFAGFLLVLLVNSTNAASITVSPPKHEFDTEPGVSIAEVISITNGDFVDLVLESSVADFIAEGEAGKAAFVENEDESTFSLASWITLPDGQIIIPAGEKVEIPFSITIPENAEAGGHFGTIFFSPVVEDEGGVAVRQKVGVLLLVRVSGDVIEEGELSKFGAYSADTKIEQVANKKPSKIFQKFPINFATRVTNTGNVHIKPIGTITLTNTFGKELTRVGEKLILNDSGAVKGLEISDTIPVNDSRGNVLPESSRVYLSQWKGYASVVFNDQEEREIVWKGIGLGRYKAELKLQYGENQFEKQVIHFWVIPWMIILPSLIGLIILIWIIKKARHSSRERLKSSLRKEIEGEDGWT
jgi:hypothetical protein